MDSQANSLRGTVSPEEWELRLDLACAYRLAAYYEWDDFVFTHISARLPGTEGHFLLNPLDHLFEEITASSLVAIDGWGNKVRGGAEPINRAGFAIHSAIHRSREDAHCVVHLHTPEGQAVSAMKEGLLPLTQNAMLIRDDIAYHDYGGPVLAGDEAGRLLTALGDKHYMLLRNHGILTLGSTVGMALMRAFLLLRACHTQVMALAAGRKGVILPEDKVISDTAATANGMYDFLRDSAWPILRRKMDRLDPGYRN
jgi:ribulose-5-phosphate 4-epimerase/fuculose-1-phosphate aldolase